MDEKKKRQFDWDDNNNNNNMANEVNLSTNGQNRNHLHKSYNRIK